MKKLGRPRKEDSSNEDQKLVTKRNYQRTYQSQVKEGVEKLLKDEKACHTDLKAANKEIDQLNKDKKKLIKFVEDCDEQLGQQMMAKFNKIKK